MKLAQSDVQVSVPELATLLARGYLRSLARKTKQADVNVTFRESRKSQNSVDEIANHEQLCVHADGGAKG